jgi:hypothetical protein
VSPFKRAKRAQARAAIEGMGAAVRADDLAATLAALVELVDVSPVLTVLVLRRTAAELRRTGDL